MTDFLFEGGYAAYVWPAYLITALALTLLGAWTVTAYRAAKAELARIEKSSERRPS